MLITWIAAALTFGAPPEPASGAAPDAPGELAKAAGAVLAGKCLACHGPTLQKGGLELGTYERLVKGGDDGAVIVAGKPEASELLRRLTLPADDDEHMPPTPKPQPLAAEIETLRRWIAAGAPAYAELSAAADSVPAPSPLPVVPPADPKHLAQLAARFVHTEPLARGSNVLAVTFAAVAPQIDDAQLEACLAPLREQVAELSVARTKITDRSAALIASLPHLTVLDASGTDLSPRGLELLAKAPTLTRLTVSRTKLGTAAVEPLSRLKSLRTLHAWSSGLTAADSEALRRALPNLLVDLGDMPDAPALEREESVPLSSEAPPIATDAKPAASPADKPN